MTAFASPIPTASLPVISQTQLDGVFQPVLEKKKKRKKKTASASDEPAANLVAVFFSKVLLAKEVKM